MNELASLRKNCVYVQSVPMGSSLLYNGRRVSLPAARGTALTTHPPSRVEVKGRAINACSRVNFTAQIIWFTANFQCQWIRILQTAFEM